MLWIIPAYMAFTASIANKLVEYPKSLDKQVLNEMQVKDLMPEGPKVLICFHICPIKIWKQVVTEQVKTIIESGLLQETASILLGVSGQQSLQYEQEKINVKQTSFRTLHNTIKDDDEALYIQVETFLIQTFPELGLKLKKLYSTNEKSFENTTINALIEHSIGATQIGETYNVLYLHNKGCFHHNNVTELWRKSMMFHVVTNWKLCVNLLNYQKHDTVGPYWVNDHYSGNFWWSHTNFLSKMPLISKLNNRFQAEKLFSSNKHSFANLIEKELTPYFTPKFIFKNIS